ncbi:hypothetical protein Gohar_026817 [Gossypium harknessii]|uniref:Uncharacterized protein n=1 Tax=Gossypium harknessii TaxID=34285 RepID=A0A7J9HVG8_9ROSI|nr:hypothetical protein [Gossypium harknessii]
MLCGGNKNNAGSSKEEDIVLQEGDFVTFHKSFERCFIKSNTPIQLMDLENVYYFVKCKDEQDYTKALMEGP